MMMRSASGAARLLWGEAFVVKTGRAASLTIQYEIGGGHEVASSFLTTEVDERKQ